MSTSPIVPSPVVSVSWLAEHLSHPNVILFDASIKKVSAPEDEPVSSSCIPGARFFDLKGAFCDPQSELPNTFPSAELFQRGARALGVNNSHCIVVYDNKGVYSSPRVWWLFQSMGHENIAVLNGGLPEWLRQGLETQSEFVETTAEGTFSAEYQAGRVYSIQQVEAALGSDNHLSLDARAAGRFAGTQPEPREGLSSGHMPHSKNLPYTEVVKDGILLSPDELRKKFEVLSAKDKRLICSCGSGITACALLLAATSVGYKDLVLFDGSWTEWASSDMPISK